MKEKQPKKIPTFSIPGKKNPKKDLIAGAVLLVILFLLVILLGRHGMFGETLAEYDAKKQEVEKQQDTDNLPVLQRE